MCDCGYYTVFATKNQCFSRGTDCYTKNVKVYIATEPKGHEAQKQAERLVKAARRAGLHDYYFARDAAGHKELADGTKQLWNRIHDEIAACDAYLIDISDYPTDEQLVEAGMAYALRKTVVAVKRPGLNHEAVFDGIARTVITYHDHDELVRRLRQFEKDQTFNLTDKSMLFTLFLLAGGVLAYLLAQLWIPLAIIGAIVYWLVVRQFVTALRAFDRVVIYIPLFAIWAGGYFWLDAMNVMVALAWAIVFWVVMLPLLQRLKFVL